jgi:hypothetical protein
VSASGAIRIGTSRVAHLDEFLDTLRLVAVDGNLGVDVFLQPLFASEFLLAEGGGLWSRVRKKGQGQGVCVGCGSRTLLVEIL